MQKTNAVPVTILCIAPILILFTIILSILYGAKSIDAETVWNALFHFDSSDVNHNIIITSRLPRVVAALLVGAFLAISGALMQGMTRNYLASPSIMGVTDGAAFVITLCMIFLPGMSSIGMVVCSMIGSALGAGIVFGFGSLLQNGLSPVRLTILSLGEEVSINLGQRTKLVKAMAILSVIFLTGTAVALVGKVGFVGLIIPHITRFIIGVDYKWILPCAGVIGGVFLALCDILSRFVNYPFETPIGVVTSLIGIPFFLYLIRTRGGERHA